MLLNNPITKKEAVPVKKAVNYKAEFAYDNMHYPGVIVNLSENSLYMISFPTNSPIRLAPGTRLQVKLDPPYQEPICLQCQVIWSYKTPPHGLTHSIGMEIVNAFPNYQNFLKDLS
ncbi:MAG: PilZ domain-containing protein [Nitrospirae bacterium]|nr:PilZ domain-containing protein [Nitrospirota bacterium]